ncbi:hypothetical protein INT47_004951 [Mucor saturninus]|uniref:Uncharacterized protein n=1 Tax=Mucor saturninus TaxID=64648 RepID=A0A8H7R258_9FUNG|nr:hypothetical protein INT47_004951 [Mucor saturninus]
MLESLLFKTEGPDDANLKSHGYLVKTLTIHNDNPSMLKNPHQLLGTIVSYFPFIKCLDVSQSNDPVPYLHNLTHIKSGTALNILEEIRVFSKHTLSPVNSTRVKNYYLGAIYTFRMTLRHIELLDPVKKFNIGDQRGLNYLQVLAMFRKLSHLTLHYHTEDRINALSIYAEVFTACPKLRSFDYICDGMKDTMASQLKHHPSSCINKVPIKIYPDFRTNTQLNSLSLSLPSLDKHQMKYITEVVPTAQMEKCEILLDHVDTFKYWAGEINMQKVKRFGHHLSLAKNLVIRVRQGYTNLNKPIRLVHQSKEVKNEIQKESLVKFLHALQGNRKFDQYKLNVELVVRKKEHDFQQISEINTIITNDSLSFHQTIDTDYFCIKRHNILTTNFADGQLLSTKIRHITIRVARNDLSKVLKFVLKHCKKAETIVLIVGRSQREMTINIPEQNKVKVFGKTQPKSMMLNIHFGTVSQALLYELISLMPGLNKLVLQGIDEENLTEPLLDFIKARRLKELVFEFVIGDQEESPFYIKMGFYNTKAKREERDFRCLVGNIQPANIPEETVCLPELTIWHTSIERVTMIHNGRALKVLAPPLSETGFFQKNNFTLFGSQGDQILKGFSGCFRL